jgi:ornithine cyclodeaminase/alanine dehydrogenase-like protein (mu-crystallin family)
VDELGDVLAGVRPGRQTADEVTLYKSTGSAFQDVVTARMIYDAAVAGKVGRDLDLGGVAVSFDAADGLTP